MFNFDPADNVFNILTKKVLPKTDAERFLNAEDIGRNRYNNFVKERLEGEGCIWDTVKKEKISTFVKNNTTTTVNVNNQVIKLKEERKLMNRLLVASRTRTDIDLPDILGNYEFSVVPLSMFQPDGSLLYPKDKSLLATELRKMQAERNEDNSERAFEGRRVIIIDAMAVVNKIDIKKSQIRNCEDFASRFVDMVKSQAASFDEVRVIFDRYEIKSLKGNTRINRSKGTDAVYYKITESTKIGHLTTKQLLSSVVTKNELTKFLSFKMSRQIEKDHVVVYGNTCLTNIQDINPQLYDYNQEEADTGIVLHSIDASQRDPFTDLVVSCSDTDVLIILLNYFDQLSSCTTFKTTQHEYFLRSIHEKLEENTIQALLGFHALTGSDQTSRFSGYSKKSCWETLLRSPQSVLEAFSKLGTETSSHSEFDSLEMFVIQLYCKNKVPSHTVDLAGLRWHMFSKLQLDSQKLPPTREAFRQKVLRAHYTAKQWKSSHIASPRLPNPEDNGWKWDTVNSIYVAVTTSLNPAPESIVNLINCSCKTHCGTNRCKCRKNELKCSEMCLCDSCENGFEDDDFNVEDYEFEEEDIFELKL